MKEAEKMETGGTDPGDREQKSLWVRRPRLSMVALAAAGFLGALAIVLVAILNSASLKEFMRQELIHVARQHDLPLSLESASCSITGCDVKNASLFFPEILLLVKIEGLHITPNLASFITSKPSFSFSGRVYGGQFEGDISYAARSDEVEGSFRARGIRFNEIPQLAALGINAGSGEISLSNFSGAGAMFDLKSGVLKASDVSRPSRGAAASGGFDIPAISNVQALVDLSAEKGIFKVARLSLTSSLGQVSGQGEAVLSGKSGTSSLKGKVALSDDGSRLIGPLLPLISQGVVPSSSKNFEVKLEGSLAEPRFKFAM